MVAMLHVYVLLQCQLVQEFAKYLSVSHLQCLHGLMTCRAACTHTRAATIFDISVSSITCFSPFSPWAFWTQTSISVWSLLNPSWWLFPADSWPICQALWEASALFFHDPERFQKLVMDSFRLRMSLLFSGALGSKRNGVTTFVWTYHRSQPRIRSSVFYVPKALKALLGKHSVLLEEVLIFVERASFHQNAMKFHAIRIKFNAVPFAARSDRCWGSCSEMLLGE